MIEYRKAHLLDAEDIIRLIAGYAAEGLMLPRTRNSVYEGIWEYWLALDGDTVVGVGGLHVIWCDLAEVRALAVDKRYARQGIGKRLVGILLEEARRLKCPKVFTLTYQVAFFEKLGFTFTEKEDMPHKVWKECLNCVKFPNCDENALMLDLTGLTDLTEEGQA